jgi:hypothetical protein
MRVALIEGSTNLFISNSSLSTHPRRRYSTSLCRDIAFVIRRKPTYFIEWLLIAAIMDMITLPARPIYMYVLVPFLCSAAEFPREEDYNRDLEYISRLHFVYGQGDVAGELILGKS